MMKPSRTAAALTLLVAIAIVAGPNCGSSGTSETSGLPAALRLSELSAPQIEAFCAWANSSTATCTVDAGALDAGALDAGALPDAGATTQTPLEACVAAFPALPDCSIAQYEACERARRADPCGATTAADCLPLGTCPAQERVAPSNDGMGDLAWVACSGEVLLGPIGVTVWGIRMALDHYVYAPAPLLGYFLPQVLAYQYCLEYSYVCDHYNWQQGCVCKYCQTCCAK